MNFPPQNSSASNLEMPTGTCVDLQFSGYQYYDYNPAANPTQTETAGASFFNGTNSPLYVVFGPGGDVQFTLDGNGINYRPTRTFFLVGTTEKAIDGAGDVSYLATNLNDRTCQWVSVNARSGYVSTADNAGIDNGAYPMGVVPGTPAYRGTAIGRARAMTAAFNTKGGR
jgi:hypothetical protein